MSTAANIIDAEYEVTGITEVTDATQATPAATSYNLELIPADQIRISNGNAIAQLNVSEAAIAALRTEYANLKIELGDKAGYKTLVAAIANVRGLRTDLERARKEGKAPYLLACSIIDDKAKAYTSALEAIEKPMKKRKEELDAEIERRKEVEKAKEAEKKAQEEARAHALKAKVIAIETLPATLLNMTSDQLLAELDKAITTEIEDTEFLEFTYQAEQAIQKRIDALSEALDQRKQFEEAERLRKEEEEKLAQQRAELEAKARADEERMAAQQRELEKTRAELAEQQRKIDETKAQTEKQEQDRLMKEKAEQEAKAQAEAEAKAKAEREEQARVEAEAKAAALPDLEKLKAALIKAVDIVPTPDQMKTRQGENARLRILTALSTLVFELTEEV